MVTTVLLVRVPTLRSLIVTVSKTPEFLPVKVRRIDGSEEKRAFKQIWLSKNSLYAIYVQLVGEDLDAEEDDIWAVLDGAENSENSE